MPTSRTTFLYKPIPGERVPTGTFVYMRARAKQHAYNLVIKEFIDSDISKAELARRLGKGADRVSKILAGPANWTIDTQSDLLFAIRGGVPKYSIDYPLDRPPRNFSARERYDFKGHTGSTQDTQLVRKADTRDRQPRFDTTTESTNGVLEPA